MGKLLKVLNIFQLWRKQNIQLLKLIQKLDKNGKFIEELVSCRQNLNFILAKPENVDYIDVSPKQLVSVAASLNTFFRK